MDNLSRQLESLFVDLESKLPTFDSTVDKDSPVNADEDDDCAALEAAYPVFYQNLNLAEDIDLAALELSPRLPDLSPRPEPKPQAVVSHTPIVYELETTNTAITSHKVDACVGDDTPSNVKDDQDLTPRNITPRGHAASHDSLPPYSFGSNSTASRSQVESQSLVDKYFPSTGIQLAASAGLDVDDLDRILECFDDSFELNEPDCFQRSENMLSDPNHRTLPQPEDRTSVILEKLIMHASKYDEGLKVKDFDLKNGSLKANKRHKHHQKREKRECWTGEDAAVDAPMKATTCSRGVTAIFPSEEVLGEKKPESETVFIDVRLDEGTLEEKRRYVQRVQTILGISQDSSSSSDSDDD